MLGATQSVDMISSLRQKYGRVEVAVLNVELLSIVIGTVVIGDRMFSLPIQVEGRGDVDPNDIHMEVWMRDIVVLGREMNWRVVSHTTIPLTRKINLLVQFFMAINRFRNQLIHKLRDGWFIYERYK
jgi:hypothetical protein